ncbi:hypothetical protein ACH5A3_43135 [Streptomyces echinatus]|uniref:hypothetical protein n=1 Tax=Streptomyces echinatus TaxID=67293 RepID=UPI00378F8618
MELVVRGVGVGESQDECAVLGWWRVPGDVVLLGLVAGGGVGGGAVHFAVVPQDVAFDAVLAVGPAEGAGGVVRGGEVVGEAGKAAAGARRPPLSATSCIPRRTPQPTVVNVYVTERPDVTY